MKRRLVRAFLFVSKYLGLFHISRRLTKDRLRILCYHGFAVADEHKSMPTLFMEMPLFRRRMQCLADKKYPVVGLADGIKGLRDGTLPPSATVITIDDGFASVHSHARPVLAKHGFPATLYVTSYHFLKQTPIYRLMIRYMMGRTPEGTVVDLSGIGVPAFESAHAVTLAGAERARIATTLRDYGETACEEPERQAIAAKLAAALGIDYEHICTSRALSLIGEAEALELERDKVSIALHTHRHRFPIAREKARRELEQNRTVLRPVLGDGERHFCYPSGEWSKDHWPVLQELEIETATTCDTGLARRDCHRYALPRILDDERVSQIEFEAEMAGYLDLIRDVRGAARFRWRVRRPTLVGTPAVR